MSNQSSVTCRGSTVCTVGFSIEKSHMIHVCRENLALVHRSYKTLCILSPQKTLILQSKLRKSAYCLKMLIVSCSGESSLIYSEKPA